MPASYSMWSGRPIRKGFRVRRHTCVSCCLIEQECKADNIGMPLVLHLVRHPMKIAMILPVLWVVSAASAGAQTATPLSSLLDRASTYVRSYMQTFSTMVAEERYMQDARP